VIAEFVGRGFLIVHLISTAVTQGEEIVDPREPRLAGDA